MSLTFWITVSIILSILQLGCSQKLSKDYLQGIIDNVNSAGAHWEAGHNFDEIDDTLIQDMVGSEHTADDSNHIKRINHIYNHHPHLMIPPDMGGRKEFDGTKEWKKCPSVKEIKNQGRCAADWAIAPVSAITDRICISSNGSQPVELSAHEPISCCKTCGWGCRKGYPQMVYKQYVTKGLVTGGKYKSKKGCQPYEIPPCNGNFKKCFLTGKFKTPKCKPYCYNSRYNKKYAADRNKGFEAFRICCPCCATGELIKHGPLTATMEVYEDFLTYKKGVYHHVSGKQLGFLTVKLVGFNDSAEPKYWIAINSWGKKWGDKGMFKIKRGVHECMIEGSLRGVTISEEDVSSSEED